MERLESDSPVKEWDGRIRKVIQFFMELIKVKSSPKKLLMNENLISYIL